ncbi:glycosyltransferase [Chroococcus sp. FPU101]|uniref:glycosyltransferase n=1 Tax=Chroococcus sp. FPU101 TaxID=1974212 RepID=UPI001F5CAB1B|nr:glycosyltransferase [Chroococcus sp. FPU101]
MKPDSAHEIHDVMCANAAKNLGYSSIFAYPNYEPPSSKTKQWLFPSTPQLPTQAFKEFYNVDDGLKITPLPIPKLLDKYKNRIINPYKLVYQYYLPLHIIPTAKIVHTRDWSCVKAAVKKKINVIYERHYFEERVMEPKITNSPYLKIAITQSDLIKKSLIEFGMPEHKVFSLHNGFSQSFLVREPEAAQEWRNKLLKNNRQQLVIYSGALYSFKGIDVLIDAAKHLPNVQFAVTGGTPEQVEHYRQSAKDKQVDNIDFLGWILPRSSLISLLQAADILAHPHCSGHSASFTNPVKFFQYIAVGVPIVATEIEPLMEFKKSPIVGAWCEPDHPVKFAECIKKVLQQYPRKVEGYAENISFAQQFTWEARSAKILQLANL